MKDGKYQESIQPSDTSDSGHESFENFETYAQVFNAQILFKMLCNAQILKIK